MTWPQADATALDRARAIARTYRASLAQLDPQRARILDEAAREVGEGWVASVTLASPACTVADAALLLQVSPRRVRQLIDAGHLPAAGRTAGGWVLLVDDVTAYRARRAS